MPDPFPRQIAGLPDLRKAYNELHDPSSPVPAPDSNSSTTRDGPRTVNDKHHGPASKPLAAEEVAVVRRTCEELAAAFESLASIYDANDSRGRFYRGIATDCRGAIRYGWLSIRETLPETDPESGSVVLAVDPSRSTPEEVDPAVSEVSRLRSQVERMTADREQEIAKARGDWGDLRARLDDAWTFLRRRKAGNFTAGELEREAERVIALLEPIRFQRLSSGDSEDTKNG